VVAKIEREAAVHDLDAILKAADAVMVARGDLGIEAEISMVPIYQKQIVESCVAAGIPVIIATQMLEGMMKDPLPTRAEANDVATAIFSGSDAIMLSGETAVGRYPVPAVSMMRRIADNAESSTRTPRRRRRERSEDLRDDTESALAGAVCRAAEALSAAAIIAQTISGSTARLIAKYRPAVPIIATTPEERTYYQLSLVWGVEPVLSPQREDDFLETVRKNDSLLQRRGMLAAGDLTIISAGIPSGSSGGTNLMKVHLVGQRY
jgi:pyruvate kinase